MKYYIYKCLVIVSLILCGNLELTLKNNGQGVISFIIKVICIAGCGALFDKACSIREKDYAKKEGEL